MTVSDRLKAFLANIRRESARDTFSRLRGTRTKRNVDGWLRVREKNKARNEETGIFIIFVVAGYQGDVMTRFDESPVFNSPLDRFIHMKLVCSRALT